MAHTPPTKKYVRGHVNVNLSVSQGKSICLEVLHVPYPPPQQKKLFEWMCLFSILTISSLFGILAHYEWLGGCFCGCTWYPHTWSIILSLPCRENNTKKTNHLRSSPGIYLQSRGYQRWVTKQRYWGWASPSRDCSGRPQTERAVKRTPSFSRWWHKSGPVEGTSFSIVVGAERDAATPSSEHSEGGDGSGEGERASAEDGHLGRKGSGSCVGALGVCRRYDGVLTGEEKALRWKLNRRRLRGEWHEGYQVVRKFTCAPHSGRLWWG